MISGLPRRVWRYLRWTEHPPPMSTEEAEAGLVPESSGVRVLDDDRGEPTEDELERERDAS